MKHKIFFLFLLMLMYTGGALGADILTGYVLLNGEQVEAEYTKLSANTVARGTMPAYRSTARDDSWCLARSPSMAPPTT